MDSLFNSFSNFYNRQNFRVFQNVLGRKMYETLGTSYSNSDGEVKIVTDLCKTINGETFGELKLFATKIHGSRSFVEFHNQDKPTTKELADMVIISVATKDRKIVYEKTAFIQNKKEESENIWKIDQDQLYLLHNFPTFEGKKGIFRESFNNNVVFQNHSKSLGNYGLFKSPGEMILVNALTVFRLQQGDKISFSDVRKYSQTQNNVFSFLLLDYPFLDKMLCRYFKNYTKYDFPLPFLGNSNVSFNIYDFIRNWLLFNIGEVVSVNDLVVDSDLWNFNRVLLHKTGFSNDMDLKTEIADYKIYEPDNNLAILVAHFNLDEK